MPKVIKKTVKKSVAEKIETPEAPPKITQGPTVFRVFECLVHAEQAFKHLESAAIFTEPGIEEARAAWLRAKEETAKLVKYHREAWNRMNGGSR